MFGVLEEPVLPPSNHITVSIGGIISPVITLIGWFPYLVLTVSSHSPHYPFLRVESDSIGLDKVLGCQRKHC